MASDTKTTVLPFHAASSRWTAIQPVIIGRPARSVEETDLLGEGLPGGKHKGEGEKA
jgi:hypothetical protein